MSKEFILFVILELIGIVVLAVYNYVSSGGMNVPVFSAIWTLFVFGTVLWLVIAMIKLILMLALFSIMLVSGIATAILPFPASGLALMAAFLCLCAMLCVFTKEMS